MPIEREALQRISDGVVSFDHEWRCTYINRAGAQLLGYGAAELVGKIWWDLFPEARDKPFRQACEAAIKNQEPAFHEDYYAPWGRWFHYNIFPAKDGFSVYFREVTAQKRAIQALRESEETMRGLLSAASEAVVTVDEQGTITFVNAEAEQMFERRAVEMLGQSLELLFPERFRQSHARFLEAYVRAPEVRRMGRGRELVGIRRNGSEFPVEISLSPVRTRAGLLVMALMTDVTERQQAAEALRRTTNRLQILHEIDRAILSSRSPVATARAALRRIQPIVGCQRASISLWDAETDELTLLATETPEKTAIQPGNRVPYAASGLTPEFKSGRVQYVRDLLSVSPKPAYVQTLIDEGLRSCLIVPLMADGELIGSMALWSSETAGFTREHREIAVEVATQLSVALRQARLLEQVQRHAEEMEQRVAERTAQLEAANRELESFAYTAAHDLRSPLRAMSMYAGMLLEDYGGKLDEEAEEYARRIAEAAALMDEMIRDILEYSQLALDDVDLERVDLQSSLMQAVALMEDSIRQAKATVSLPAGLPSVRGNQRLLVQALANLLSNAIKFVPESRTPVVKIRHESREDQLRLWVEDNGIGISEEHFERIFTMFERLHGLDTYPGTGIGLALVRKAMERMGGSVGVESQPGKGSAFWIELPLASGS